MPRTFYGYFFVAGLFIVHQVLAVDETQRQTGETLLPVTTLNSPAADKVKAWYEAGTAAGNAGDVYDNRDRAHSRLNLQHFPQLTQRQYTEAEIKENIDFGAQRTISPGVVFGNSSTAGGVLSGGSNARRYYTRAQGLDILHRQYRANNLYVYPEHRDHDPGHNGLPGHGDLFPTNTPYLITSQGSSGSDQPFLRALPLVLAAFRPQVKQRLVRNGMLMPTIQMILRATYPTSNQAIDYLDAKAHPTVFEGKKIDPLAMVDMAQAIKPDDIPPIVRLRVLNETPVFRGKDFFDPQPSEALAGTPGVIARIFRGAAYQRRMRVSVQDSFDLNNRELEFHWVLLRGDKTKVRITPQKDNNSVAEIEVSYHPRIPIQNRSIESSRIDIGVFAHNGKYFSAPAFITWFSLDHESRAYADDGRVLEIAYGLGTVQSQINNWAGLLSMLEPEQQSLGGRLLRASLPENYQQKLLSFSRELTTLGGLFDRAESNLATASDDLKSELRKQHNTARDRLDDYINAARPDLDGLSIDQIFKNTFSGLWEGSNLISQNEEQLAALVKAVSRDKQRLILETRDELIDYGVAKKKEPGDSSLSLTFSTDLSEFAHNQIARFNSVLLNELVFNHAVSFEFKINYVDPHLSLRKQWRDVYRYNDGKQLLGWTRYEPGRKTEFNHDGLIILEQDALGRCIRCRIVSYEFADGKGENDRRYPVWTPLQHVPGNQIWTYQYADDSDFRGRVAERRKPGG